LADVKPTFDAVKQIGKNGRRDGGPDQTIGFKDLN